MKRKDPYVNLSWPIYVVFVALGCLLAKVLFDGLEINATYNWHMNIIIYDILVLVYGYVSCVLFYMLGKVIFAKLAGFDILYFNFLLIGIKKENGKIKFYNGAKEDFSCNVEIVPNPNKKQNIPLALWGGTIGITVSCAVTYILLFALDSSSTTKCFFILSSFFYLFAFIAYMIPVRMDNITDGFALVLIHKYKLGEAYLRNKRNLRAMYDSKYELEYFDYGDNNDPISMEGKCFNFYYSIRKNDMELIKDSTSKLAESYKFVIGEDSTRLASIAQAYLLSLNDQVEELKDFYWKLDTPSRKALRNTKNLDSMKIGYYIEGIVEDSKEGLQELIDATPKCAQKYKYKAQVEAEMKFIEELKEAIYTKNPGIKM